MIEQCRGGRIADCRVIEILSDHALCGTVDHAMPGFGYRTRKTWSCERRVVAKVEHLSGGENPRFIATSIAVEQWAGRELCEQGYCARGEMENRIKGAPGELVTA